MHLLGRIEAFLKLSRMPASRFGREAVGDPRFVFDLINGREPRRATVERVLAWLDRQQAEHA